MRLGDSRQLEEVGGAQLLDEADDLPGEGFGQLGGAQAQDLQLAGGVRIADPVVEAAPLERVVDLARAVRGEHDDRRRRRAHGAHLRDRHLEVAQDLQEEGFERLVGAVDLVDQEDRRPGGIGLQRQEERALEQEALVEDVVRQALPPFGSRLAAQLRQPDLQHLAGVVPLVERRRGVEPLVALEADEPPAQRLGEDLGDLGLADARLSFEEKRASELEGQEDRGGEARVGDVAPRREQLARVLDGPRQLQLPQVTGRPRRRAGPSP